MSVERPGGYWLVGLLLAFVGVRGGFLPATPARTNASAASAPSAAAPSSKLARPRLAASSAPAATASSQATNGDCTEAGIHVHCQPPPKPDPPDPCQGGQEIIDEYTAIYPPQSPGSAWSRADYVLALVPDPDLVEQSSTFSAVVEGLTEAATEESAFVRDRQWLPWGGEGAGCADRAPGVLLFRPENPTAKPPRIVLLVGESPAWGARKEQLLAAASLVQAAPGEAKLRVLGPTFSGTASSLVALLAPLTKPSEKQPGPLPLSFRFVSGSATSPGLPKLFAGAFGKGSFEATVPDDQVLLEAMRRYLDARSFPKGKIAILSEAGTAYGSSVSEVAADTEALDEVAEASAPQPPPTPKPAQGSADKTIITRRFPIDLRPLREAVASAPAPGGSLEQAPKTTDDPRVLVLDEVARELSAKRVRFVGVVATNPTDVVLLMGRLRTQLPDARFFTLGGDVLFTSTSLVSPLNGMLVAHAAPPSEDHMPRSVSMKSELVRNVTLAGLRLFNPAHERAVFVPQARISLIGNGSLWEIGDKDPSATPPHSWRIVFAITCLILAVILGFASWPWLVRVWPGLRHTLVTRQRGPLTLAIGPCERRDLRVDDALVTAALLSVVSAGPLLMLVTEFSRSRPGWCTAGTISWFVLCWSQVIVLATRRLWRVARRWLRLGRRAHRKPHWPHWLALSCGLIALVVVALALGIGCAPAHEATLNLLSGGSAVLAGLIGFAMLSISLWCWRVRLRFLDTHRFGSHLRTPPIAQALNERPRDGTGIYELEKHLLDVIHSPWNALPLVPLTVHALLLLTIAMVFWVRVPAAFEPGWRNYLVVGFGLLALLPITVNFSRIVATFFALNRLLKRLALEPFIPHLRALPPDLARNLQAQLTVPNADMTELARPIALLREISQHSRSFPFDAERIHEAWQNALRHQAGQPDETQTSHQQGLVLTKLLAASGALRGLGHAQLAEQTNQLVALLVAIFVPRYLRHFRLYVIPVLFGSALGVMMTSLYFIQPQRLISTVVFVWVAAMVLITFLLYQALDRTPIISAIGKTTEGAVELDWSLFSRMATWALVPLLSLIAAQYPGFSSWISLIVNGFGNALR